MVPGLGLTLIKINLGMCVMKVFDLRSYILEIPNVVSDELCESILNEYGKDAQWFETTVGPGVVNRSVRNVDCIGISRPDTILNNPLVRKTIDNELFSSINQAKEKYVSLYPHLAVESDSGYDLLRYDEGMFYVQHVDSFKAQPRSISCSLSLNDDYEGGLFSFFDREIRIKPKKGSALLFPSSFQYPHEIEPVTKGTRYSVITWLI
jgi:predicted 2-oxoglutarate/Fe(II)-dependent dioxygenase YbiX